METLHEESPDLLKPFRLDGVSLYEDPAKTNQAVDAMRAVGLNCCFQAKDGTIYSSSGGGFGLQATRGGPSNAGIHQRVGIILARVEEIEKWVDRHRSQIVVNCINQGQRDPVSPFLKVGLINSKGTLIVVEKEAGLALFPFWGNFPLEH